LTGSDTNPNPNVITFDGSSYKSKLGTNATGSITAWFPLTTNTCDLHIGYDAGGGGFFDKRWNNISVVSNATFHLDTITSIELSARPATWFGASDYRRALLFLNYDGATYSSFLGAGYSTTLYGYFYAITNSTVASLGVSNYTPHSTFTFANHESIIIDTPKTPAAAAVGTKGMVCWDESYIHVCVATNTWKKVAIA
jgi:hypothetical protein